MIKCYINTLAYANKLKAAGVPANQAEAQAETLFELIEEKIESAEENFATKDDIIEVRRDIKELELRTDTKLSDLKAEMVKWMIGMGVAQAAVIISVLKICH